MILFNSVSAKEMRLDDKFDCIDSVAHNLSQDDLEVDELDMDEGSDELSQVFDEFNAKLDELAPAAERLFDAFDIGYGCVDALDELKDIVDDLADYPLNDRYSIELSVVQDILESLTDTAQEMDDRNEAADIFNRLVMDMCDEGETKSGFIYDRYHVYISPDDADAFRDDSDWLETLVTAPKSDFDDMYGTAQRALDGWSMRQDCFALLNDYLGGVIQFD